MAYVGNTPAEAYISISSQTFTTINGTGYVLSSSVTNSEDIALFLNNVRQKPSTYTATGTALTMGTATTTLDALYCVYLGKALQTVNPPAGSVGTTSIADDAVTTAKILDSNVTYAKIQDTTTANRVIGAATAGVVSEVQVVDDMTNFVSTASAPGVTVKGDGSTDGYLQLNCDQNTHGIKLKSPPHSAGQSYTLTFPITAPATDRFIQTTAAGQLSFTSVPETDLTPVNQDILTLALRQSIDNNSAKYNLPNSAITHFESDADYDSGGSTDITRNASEYISTASIGTADGPNILFCGHMEDVGLTDSSSFAWATTLRSGVARSAAEAKFGSYSALSSGATSATMYTGSFGTNLTTENFTVDFWAKNQNTSQGGANRVFSLGNGSIPGDSGTGPSFSYAWSGGGGTNFNLYNEYSGANPTPASLSTLDTNWNHWAWMRDGRDIHWAQNGVWKSSSTNIFDASGTGATINNGSNSLGIFGRGGSTAEIFNAYIDEFRVSKVQQYTVGVNFTPETSPYTASSTNATGTALGTTNVPTAPVTSVSGVILMKNGYGTNVMGTDVKVYFTADNSNWTEASSYTSAGTFSTGVTQITLGQTTVTSGSDVRWKIEFANQVASSKEAYIYGMGTNY